MRDQPMLLREFIQKDGVRLLAQMLSGGAPARLAIKLLYFIASLETSLPADLQKQLQGQLLSLVILPLI